MSDLKWPERDLCHLWIKMKTNMTIVLFFSLSPTANCPCKFDGMSKKLEQITKYKGFHFSICDCRLM